MKPCTMENKDRFKFRLWCKETKKYYQDEDFCINATGSIVIQTEFEETPWFEDDFIIEQCTGLRDVTGKLIYEGDIIKYNFPGTLPEIVAWNPKSCRFISHLARDFCMVFATNLGRDGDLPNFAVRIVGNVHEEKSK